MIFLKDIKRRIKHLFQNTNPVKAYNTFAPQYDLQKGNLLMEIDKLVFEEMLDEINIEEYKRVPIIINIEDNEYEIISKYIPEQIDDYIKLKINDSFLLKPSILLRAVSDLSTTADFLALFSYKNILENKLEFGEIDLQGLFFYLKTYEGEDNDNLSIFVEKFEDNDSTKTSSNPFLLTSTRLNLENANFYLFNKNNWIMNPILNIQSLITQKCYLFYYHLFLFQF